MPETKFESHVGAAFRQAMEWRGWTQKLRESESIEERQNILNELFPLSRRQEMLRGASVDVKGRRVLYYRYMRWEKIFELLEKGEQTSMDYVENPHARLSDEDVLRLQTFFLDYAVDFLHEGEWEDLKSLSLEELINGVFKDVSWKERAELIREPTYEVVLPFIRKYVAAAYTRGRHTGSTLQRFSPFLGMSVGGPIRTLYGRNEVYAYVEMIVPDHKIIPHPEGVQGEKEVFIERLDRAYISRIYTDQQLWDEILESPDSMVGKYLANHRGEGCRTILEALEQWRWHEETEDCLPASVNASIKIEPVIMDA